MILTKPARKLLLMSCVFVLFFAKPSQFFLRLGSVLTADGRDGLLVGDNEDEKQTSEGETTSNAEYVRENQQRSEDADALATNDVSAEIKIQIGEN